MSQILVFFEIVAKNLLVNKIIQKNSLNLILFEKKFLLE